MNEDSKTRVCKEILEIIRTYHEQDKRGYVDTPRNLEHIGMFGDYFVNGKIY